MSSTGQQGTVEALLEVADLAVSFSTPEGPVQAVNGVSFSLARGETLAILGESGCGKSVTVQAVMGLVRSPPGKVTASTLRFGDVDLLSAPNKVMRGVRGPRIGMIFQDPFMSLDPTKTVGQQIGELFRVHRGMSSRDARQHAIEQMERARIPSARQRVDDYPHQFSGGMSQRVMIASAIALEPELLIADEPTTALDVTVQAQIMDLLGDLRAELGMAMILITHDIALAAEACDRAAVMYAGRLVETAPMQDLHSRPRHPYTIGLLGSLPPIEGGSQRLRPIPGSPPRLSRLPTGCAFAPRCPWKGDRSVSEVPQLHSVDTDHMVACHYADEVRT